MAIDWEKERTLCVAINERWGMVDVSTQREVGEQRRIFWTRTSILTSKFWSGEQLGLDPAWLWLCALDARA